MNSRIPFAAVLVTLVSACQWTPPPSVLPATNGACVPPGATGPLSAPQRTRVSNAAQTFDSVWTIIRRTHWDTTFNGVNWQAVRDSMRPKAIAAPDYIEFRQLLNTMLGTLGQSHFSIIPGNADRLGPGTRDQSGGTGLTVRDDGSDLLITAVRPNSPAVRAGLRPGFVIAAIDGCGLPPRRDFAVPGLDERHLKLARWKDANARLRGAVGDSLTIAARRGDGKLVSFRLDREVDPGEPTKVGNLPVQSVHLEKERRTVDGRSIGVIRFNVWMPLLAEAIAVAVDSLRGSDAIVLDLRGNVGGMGMMSAGVAGHFIDTALTLGTMVQRGGIQKYIINPQRVNGANRRVHPFAGPLAIVVDELSVSTTEIFAAGLQALGRARVFGSQTAGQALPSLADGLPNGDVLYHAVANFLSPTGQPVEGKGVTPDVAVPVTRAALLKGTDPALDAAVRWAATARRTQ